MAEYIEREAFIRTLNSERVSGKMDGEQFHYMQGNLTGLITASIEAKALPTADVVEVVRCKDCKHFTAGYCCRDIKGRSQMHYMGDNAFCSYGAKMDGKGEG